MASQSGSPELLLETRRLLNALNEENADLKNINHRLASELRRAQDALESSKRQLEASERDLKQMNFNLMHQLKGKHERIKELEKKIEEMESTTNSSRRDVARTEIAAAEVKNDNAALRERCILAEERGKALQMERDKLQGDLARLGDDLSRALASQREEGLHHQKECNITVAQLRNELETARSELLQKEQLVAEAGRQLTETKQRFAEERGRLIADAQRTVQVETEARYAHEQMCSIAELVLQHLTDFQQKVRMASEQCEQNDGTLNELVLRSEEHKALLKSLRSCDDSISRASSDVTQRLERKLFEGRNETEKLHASLHSAELRNGELEKLVREHDFQVQELARQSHAAQSDAASAKQQCVVMEATLTHTQQELKQVNDLVAALRMQLDEALSRAKLAEERRYSSEAQFTKERGEYASQLSAANALAQRTQTQLRTETDLWAQRQQKYEEELAGLRSQLQEHTSTLSTALGRLTRQIVPRSSESTRLGNNSQLPSRIDGQSPHQSLAATPAQSPSSQLEEQVAAARRRLQS